MGKMMMSFKEYLNNIVLSLQEGSTLVSGKKRLAYQASEDQAKERRPLRMKKPAVRTPAQAMFDRYKKLQEMKQQQLIEKRMAEITEDDPCEGTSNSSSPVTSTSSGKARVAHTGSGAAPVVLSKARQQLQARQSSSATPVVTNAKGTQRKAHTPTTQTVTRPLVVPDPKSKVPTNVRQKYLNSIIDTCLKICGGDELAAFSRAETEEADCCRKASSRMIYLNLVVNKIKKLRAEAVTAAAAGRSQRQQEAGVAGERRNMLTTHMQVLA